jgi:hypothetical protein
MTNAGLAGGIGNSVVATLTNATVSNNSAQVAGGGIATDPKVLAAFQERAATIAKVLGHPFAFPTTPPTTLLQSTIVANNRPGNNCFGTVTSLGFNLSSDTSCSFAGSGDLNGTNPRLGQLRNNGGPVLGDIRGRASQRRGAQEGDDNPSSWEDGEVNAGPGASPTLTQALRNGSPAIGAVLTGCPPPATDQRGVARPQGTGCDMGAFETRPSERGNGGNGGDGNDGGGGD